ncbi:MAG TPA: hypothetical protein PKY05_06760 [Fibrobacteria bacterium]|nr:hypothetical protein [Fibrobacteria bacterium]
MKWRLPLGVGVLAWCVLGCAEGDRHASTEVENEVATRLVVGSAMDSEAIVLAEVSVWDASGAKLGSGVTDSVGRFSVVLSAAPRTALLVRVEAAGKGIRAMAPLPDPKAGSGVVGLNVNGISEAAVPPEVPSDPSRGFSGQAALLAQSRGQEILSTVVGMSLDWRSIACDSTFRPVSPRPDRPPTPVAGLLKAIELRAARDGASGPAWLRERESSSGPKVASDSLFALDLARSVGSLWLDRDRTEEVLTSFDSAAGHPGIWVGVWRDKQILSGPWILQVRLPWATRPEFKQLWLHLVERSGNEADAFETSLPAPVRSRLQPGRAHEILATAVGGFVFPDSGSPSRIAALDTFLVRILPQARMALEQVRADAWIPAPAPPRDSQDRQARDQTADLIGFSLATQFSYPPNWSAYQTQPNPGSWLRTNHKPWAGPRAVLDTLRATLGKHPELRFPAPPLP